MAQFIILAHKATFERLSNGRRYMKYEPFPPILEDRFEAATLKEVIDRFDHVTDGLCGEGNSFAATVVHVRGSGRKPVGFDRTPFRTTFEAPSDASLADSA